MSAPAGGESPDTSFERIVFALGLAAGGLSLPANFMTLAKHLQDGTLNPGHVVYLRDTLTCALQLAGVEPLPT